MNANYIYNIFEKTEKENAPDLTIGFAMLRAEQPIPESTNETEIREFIGYAYNELAKEYKNHNRTSFEEVVNKQYKEMKKQG